MIINEWYKCCPLVSWGVWRQCPVTIFPDTCPWPSWAPSWKLRIYEGDLFPAGLERDIVASSAHNTWPSLFAIHRNVQGVSVVFLQCLLQVLPSSAPPPLPSSGSSRPGPNLVSSLRDFAWGLQMMLSGRGPSKEAGGAAAHYEDARRGVEAATDRKRERHTCAVLVPLRLFHLFMLCFTAFQCILMFKTRNRLQKNNNLWKEKLLIFWFFLNYLFIRFISWIFYTFCNEHFIKPLFYDIHFYMIFFHILLFYFIEFLSLFLNRTLKVMIIVRAK